MKTFGWDFLQQPGGRNGKRSSIVSSRSFQYCVIDEASSAELFPGVSSRCWQLVVR